MTDLPEKLCRITGIGQSEVGRPSDKSPIELTLDAAQMAIADAGLRVEDIDGIVNYPPKTDLGGGISPVGVNEAMFAEAVFDASLDAHSAVTVVEKRMQGRDHPILLGVPETRYLKCFILRKL